MSSIDVTAQLYVEIIDYLFWQVSCYIWTRLWGSRDCEVTQIHWRVDHLSSGFLGPRGKDLGGEVTGASSDGM